MQYQYRLSNYKPTCLALHSALMPGRYQTSHQLTPISGIAAQCGFSENSGIPVCNRRCSHHNVPKQALPVEHVIPTAVWSSPITATARQHSFSWLFPPTNYPDWEEQEQYSQMTHCVWGGEGVGVSERQQALIGTVHKVKTARLEIDIMMPDTAILTIKCFSLVISHQPKLRSTQGWISMYRS